eukprot:TRINITY_DN10800_c0_g1_i1.p1 TRINITY_DN10800_c0_g1~~TRINITY_DN10800_c0_g1_i1.p1  ORF type:complete len:169 (-),score=4.63 TRINITY_DN10800_c0_g1_i1:37-513(-)
MDNSNQKQIKEKPKNANLEIVSQLLRESPGQEISINRNYKFSDEKNGTTSEVETDLNIRLFFMHRNLYCETSARSVSESKGKASSIVETNFHKILPLREDLVEISGEKNEKIETGKLYLDLIPHSIKNRLGEKHKKIVLQFETENRPVRRIVEGSENN